MDLRRKRKKGSNWAFPPNPTQWEFEKVGINFRIDFDLGFDGPIRPFGLTIPQTTVMRKRKEVEEYVDSSVTENLYGQFAKRWSGMTIPCGGDFVVITNETHSDARNVATLMEEFMHILLKHKPTKISICESTGILRRAFDKEVEEEAYFSAAAALVPYRQLKLMISKNASESEIADHFEVSSELVRMRLKVCKLYRKRRTN